MTQSPDAALLAAYEQYRSLNAACYNLLVDDQDGNDVLCDRMVAIDGLITQTTPHTIEGVLAVLRRITPTIESERWLDRAIAYGDDETLEERKDELPYVGKRLVACILALSGMVKGGRS